jgi:hypothetical protein
MILSALLILIAGAGSLSAQEPRPAAPGARSGFQLEQNYPNPFNPETTIPFALGPELFSSGGSAVVSLRIYNLLQQLVAVPVALGHSSGEGIPVQQIEYAQPGRYEAFWDGNDLAGRQVASGIYFMQLTVNGMSTTRKMFVLK